MSRRIVIAAVDGSAESLAAAAWAAREARLRSLPLHLLHARQDRSPLFSPALSGGHRHHIRRNHHDPARGGARPC
ncbi:universal stress protein [Streptomyces sp. SM11]|uniref:universal stress protein n=1 Tax=Streptomyces sp. SM11 TaxID=565557 RepID=UPI000CD4E7C6|nr:universal stress protein [Streptomyces sp. SM11]